jgi:signal transduction histidine kinase/ligand-binding sensor domain-containing protein
MLRFALRLALAALLPAAASARDLPLRSYTTADGLIHNRVKQIVQDSRGLLWMCTSGGLSRFDGSQFQSFTVADGLPYASINDLSETADGSFWLASNGGGMIRFLMSHERSRFQGFLVSSEPASNRVNRILADGPQAFWLGTDGGLFRMTTATSPPQFTQVSVRWPNHPEATTQVWSLARDAEGSLWVGTRFGLVRILPGGHMIHYPVGEGHETDHVLSLLYSPETGMLWMGLESGLVVFKPLPASQSGSRAGSEGVPVDRVIARVAASAASARAKLDGALALPKSNGEASYFPSYGKSGAARVYAARSASGRIRVLVDDQLIEISGDRAAPLEGARLLGLPTSVEEDRAGNLWIATQTSGATRIAVHGFVSFREDDGFRAFVTGLFEEPEKRIVAVTRDWHVSVLDGLHFQAVQPKLPSSAAAWTQQAVVRDHLGDWWFATAKGLLRYTHVRSLNDLSKVSPVVYTTRDGLEQDNVYRLFEDSRGDMWISALVPGPDVLTRWDRRSERFQRYSTADGLRPFNPPTSFAEDASGVLWMAFRDGSLARYSNGTFRIVTETDGLPHGFVIAIFADHAGRLWCSSDRAGLFRIDHPDRLPLQPVVIATPQALQGQSVNRMAADQSGDLYAATNRGLLRIPGKADPSSAFRQAAFYTPDDGLVPGEILATLSDHQGRLWFGTTLGLCYLEPHRIPRATAPPVRIGGVRIGGVPQEVSPAGETDLAGLELGSNQTQLEIDFFRISFVPGEYLAFQHRIGDGEWSEPSPARSVFFSHLSPGAYEFEVRAASQNDTGAPSARVSFRVLPPFWRRWWFVAIAATVLLAGLAAFERYRAARLKELREALGASRSLAVELRQANQTLELEAAVTRILTEAATPAQAAPVILAHICGAMGWQAGAIWEVDREFGVLRCLDFWPSGPGNGLATFEAVVRGWVVEPGEGLAGHVLTSGQAHWIEDFRQDPMLSPAGYPPPDGIAGGFAFPVLLGQEVIAVVAFFGERKSPVPEQIRSLSILGSHLGQLVERKQNEEALQRTRDAQFAEMERVRQRIAADLHDEIGSSLTQISILSEVATRQGARTPEMIQPLARIASYSRELIDAMSDIVWAINPAKDHLSDLTQRMRRHASDLFTTCDIRFRLELPPSDEEVKLGANLRREIFLIFKEALNNMVKHASCGMAAIRMTLESGELCLSVEDDGKGFDLGEPAEGHGLQSIRSRAAAVGGEAEIASRPGQGTSIVVRIPIPYMIS